MHAGKLRHRITLQQRIKTGKNPDFGDELWQWQDLTNVWASIEPLSGKEFIAASATQSKITGRIVIRYRPNITPALRVSYKNNYYNIEAVLADKKSGIEYLTLLTSEISEGY